MQRALAVFRVIGSPGYPLDESALADTVCRSYDRANDPLGVARQIVAILASGDRPWVVHGEDDPLVAPDGGKATAAAIPGAELLTIPGMGHDLPRALWRTIIDAITRLARGAP